MEEEEGNLNYIKEKLIISFQKLILLKLFVDINIKLISNLESLKSV